MSTIVTYKGMDVVDPTPIGAGGLALNTNFRALGDHLEETDAHDATSTNTPSRIILRNSAGGFASGAATITSNAVTTTDSQVELIPVPLSGSVTSKPSKLRFRATFDQHGDQNPRVTTQLKSGFEFDPAIGSGVWGQEYLSFGVGSDDSAVDPTERARVTRRGIEVTNGKLIVGTPTSFFDLVGPLHVSGPGGVSATTAETIAVLERPYAAGSSFKTGARFDLGKTTSNVYSYTRLDLAIYGNGGSGAWQSPVQTWTWDGRTGINNTAPTETLDVGGNVKASGSIAAGSFVKLADVNTGSVSGTAAGQIVWDSVAGHFMGWTGSAWVQLG